MQYTNEIKLLITQNPIEFRLLINLVAAELGIEVGAVDVDFAADLGEGDDALVAVVLPCFGRDSEQLSRGF